MTLQADAMPGQAHPAYAEQAELIRSLLRDGRRSAIQVPRPSKLVASMRGVDDERIGCDPVAIRTLMVRRCVGAAPWVGGPFRYSWFAAIDELGRAVGGGCDSVEAVIDESRILIERWVHPEQYLVLDDITDDL